MLSCILALFFTLLQIKIKLPFFNQAKEHIMLGLITNRNPDVGGDIHSETLW